MLFRHHNDPLYYDTHASNKIFVPLVNEGEMTEEKSKIIASFPAEDKGEVLDEDEYKSKGYGLGAEQTSFVPGQGS